MEAQPTPADLFKNVSKIFKYLNDGSWSHIDREDYKKDSGSYKGITRRELVGKRGESPKFHVRYFEIENGGYSSFERHQHEHVVIVMRGTGSVRIGDTFQELSFGDVIYVSPNDPHQFLNSDGREPFGFLCIVNAERDRPQAVDGGESCGICV